MILRFRKVLPILMSAVLIFPAGGFAQTLPERKTAAPDRSAEFLKAPAVEKPPAVTRHTVTIDGKPVSYTAMAGEMIVNKPNEEPGAAIFYVAYFRDDVKDKSLRPLTFAYNGGPGSSSVWLHLGGLAPRLVVMDDEGESGTPPYGLADNPHSILDVTDLVFIDPVSTGYSRPLPGESKGQFHGLQEDVESVGEFIRLFTTRHERWASPKFLLGESYGTLRSAALSGFLQGRTHGMFLNGVILVSSVLDFSTIVFAPHNPLTYVLFLPHYTATAWYHKKLPGDLQAKPLREVLDMAEEFALGAYSAALIKGNRLDPSAYQDIAQKLASFTGLSVDYVKRSNLRIRHDRFVKELLRSERKTVGRLDSRFTGWDADAAGENYEFDPSMSAIMGSFSTQLNHYLRTELQYRKDIPYAIFGNVFPWNFASVPGDPRQAFRGSMSMGVNVAEILRRAMAENPHLMVFCANGYYDGATPHFATEYTFSQMGLEGELRDRVRMGYYESGHMMYIHKPSLIQFKKDVAGFIREASGR